MDIIVNKVSESGIVTLDLSTLLPDDQLMAFFDIKPFLFREMILKEKDYRTALQTTDWTSYTGKHVGIYCTADAIVPVWAYMLATVYLSGVAASVTFATPAELGKALCLKNIETLHKEEYLDKRVVIKGCGEIPIPEYAYVAITDHLKATVKSIMYGEPCSTVPLYKRPAAIKAF